MVFHGIPVYHRFAHLFIFILFNLFFHTLLKILIDVVSGFVGA